MKQVNDLLRDADEANAGSKTLEALKKYEEAVKLYPNSFEANFALGYYYLSRGVVGSNGQGNLQYMDKAIKSLETAVKLKPNSAATLSNLAIGYNFRKKWEDSVVCAYKAAKIEDSKEIVQNLVNSIAQAPDGMQHNNARVKPIMEETLVLARKYSIDPHASAAWMYVRPHLPGELGKDGQPVGGDEDDGAPGVIGNGSGFLVSADGYLITNRHVAAEKNCLFMCRFVDGTEKAANVIVIDDDADLALLKLKPDPNKPYEFLQMSDVDEPTPGATCTALGYPVAHVMNYNMQTTVGNVSSISNDEPYHVTLTAKITHGNSGGPLVDKFCRVIGVVSAGLTAYNETYGKALSAGQIRKFLNKNTEKYAPAKFEPAKPAKELDAEGIYNKASKATLCIILIRGESAPSNGGDADQK